MSTTKPDIPYTGDILKNPQRMVIWTDSRANTFQCELFEGGPGVVNGIDWGDEYGEALILDTWTEIPWKE